MEIKEKTYFEIYIDDELVTSGVTEDIKFAGYSILHYIPSGYGQIEKNSSVMIKQTLPVCKINYESNNKEKEIALGLNNNVIELLEHNLFETLNEYNKEKL